MKKWLDQLIILEKLLKRSVINRDKSILLLKQNRDAVTKAEETISRYESVRNSIKKDDSEK